MQQKHLGREAADWRAVLCVESCVFVFIDLCVIGRGGGGGGLQASTLNDVFLLVFSLVSVPVHYVCNCCLWEWNKCHSVGEGIE